MDDELSDMMGGVQLKTQGEIATDIIHDISLTNKEEIKSIRTERAEENFIELMDLINNEHTDLTKLIFLQKMLGVIYNYYSSIYVSHWEQLYIREGLYHRLPEFTGIKILMEKFLSFSNQHYDEFLLCLKQIYIKMFIANDCFHEFHNL